MSFSTESGSASLMGEGSLDEEYGCKAFCPDLTYQQRVTGFVACGAFGYLLSFVGTMALLSYSEQGIQTFAIFYTFGNVVALCSGLFLMGPGRQCDRMWDKKRRFATAFYLAMILIVFTVAITRQSVWIVIVLLLVQFCAGIWYAASYIPFGREIILTCLKSPFTRK